MPCWLKPYRQSAQLLTAWLTVNTESVECAQFDSQGSVAWLSSREGFEFLFLLLARSNNLRAALMTVPPAQKRIMVF